MRDTTKEKDDQETQVFMKGSAKGMETAAKIIEDYLNTKEQKMISRFHVLKFT